MEEINLLRDINWAVITPLLIIQAILLIVAIFDLVRIDKTNGPKWMWALIIVLINIIGPIIYFIIGRRND